MSYLSRYRAGSEEQARLNVFAQRGLVRAQSTLNDIRAILFTLNALSVKPCSAEHIAILRRLTANTRSVDEIDYFENGLLKCTSWGGITDERIEQPAADFITEDGIKVTIRMVPLVSKGNPVMAAQYNAYGVLTVPERFADVIVDEGIQLVIASDTGKILSTLNSPNEQLAARIIADPQNVEDDNFLFSVERSAGFIAIALEPKRYLFIRLHKEDMLFVPIGILLAVLAIGCVFMRTRRRLSPLGELIIAVKKHELIAHYQPIVELASGRCVGAEALLRWQRPDGEVLRPDLFIPLAEESGLIGAITDQVIGLVVRDLQAMLVSDRSLHVAINLSADDIKDGRGLDAIQAALADTGIENRQIWLEATERGFIDITSACLTLGHARELGHAVSVDDFGTGYSSLSSLQKLPLDAVKIDKSFIDKIGTDSASSSVTPHIIAMAKTLHLGIFAEGVETQGQADYLRNQKVEYAQGWLFSAAMPVEEFISYYKKNREQFPD
ncbi:EAL domain-containing protein [Herbaspirillum rhizosphaerae]|uniref:EAL domain-containing protein n=1 Tax=Herbaspirillum rhizosphaerae TaxID=346179 RepID=UPI001969F3CB|nr:EAL domain-containing protein [Herbaspirillum rhizosphaerae]